MLKFYMLRSFKRRPLRHLSLAWIMLCAFLLPLVVSIYRDSLAYGRTLQNRNFTKDQAIHISGAQPEDVAWFQDIEGLTAPYYEDRTIYMTYDSKESEARFQDIHEGVALSNLIISKARKSGRAMEVMFYDVSIDALSDPYMKTTLRNMQLVNLALLLFSGLIVQAAYRNHIDSFSQELADILTMGATKGQVVRMFLGELAILFPLSAAGAIGISYGVMRLLYERYLGNTAASAAIWRVFHMDTQSTALQIAFYLLVCVGAMVYALLKRPARMPTPKPGKAAELPQLWMRRTKTPFVTCLAILVPLLAAFVILFNQYLGIYAAMVYGPQDAAITLHSSTIQGFSQEELNFISGIDGVERVEPGWDFSVPYILHIPEQGSEIVFVHLSEELPEGSPQLEGNQFISDLPQSMESDEPYLISIISAPENQAQVTLVKRLEPEDEDTTHVYVSRELMRQISGGYTKLLVYPSPGQASAVEAALLLNLPTSVNIHNMQNYVDTTMLQQQGNLRLLSWIFCILMIVAMQIVWVRLARYVGDCAFMLRIIQQIGASRKQLAQLIPVGFGAIPAAVLPFLIAIPWAWLEAARSNRPFIISGPVLGIYLAIALLAIVTFWLPVKVSLKKILDDRK